MSRRHKRSAPLPPLQPEPVSTPPPAPARAVVLRWALPLDVGPRQAEHAGLDVKNAVMASDAFFPFRDGIDNAAKAGIACVIQPGGSMRDQEVIDAANERGVSMVFSGVRHFRH